MKPFADYKPREHWTLRVRGSLFALLLVVAYVAACALAIGCDQRETRTYYVTGPDTLAAPDTVTTPVCSKHHQHRCWRCHDGRDR